MKIFWLCKSDMFCRRFDVFLKENNLPAATICTNPSIAISEYCRVLPDVVILDLSWSNEVSGITLLNEFLKVNKNMKVILTTVYYQETISTCFEKLGASGYFFKGDDPENITDCIYNVHESSGQELKCCA